MPTYSYACTECGHRFDTVQSFTDSNLTECPACSGRLRKLFSAVGIVFKGSGFYRTDSRAGAVAAREKADKAGSNGVESKAGSNGVESKGGESKDSTKKAESTNSEGGKKNESSTAKAGSGSSPTKAS